MPRSEARLEGMQQWEFESGYADTLIRPKDPAMLPMGNDPGLSS
jgi:hypothetical protein